MKDDYQFSKAEHDHMKNLMLESAQQIIQEHKNQIIHLELGTRDLQKQVNELNARLLSSKRIKILLISVVAILKAAIGIYAILQK
jgi:hypothetical protein